MTNDTARRELVQGFFIGLGNAIARYTRLEYEGPDSLPEPPALLVANHGFGGVVDLNAFIIASLAPRLAPRDDVQFTILAHQMAWTFGLGPLLEPAGVRVASWESALAGLSEGHYVLVMPGGDLDAMKSFFHRNEVVFGGRKGFAKVALEAKVPIVPIVVSGAGETLFVVSDGQRLAKLLRLPQLLRSKTIPISISVPYGFTIGVAGLLPYFPLPAKMRAAVLEPIHPEEGETFESLAARAHGAMSAKLTEMTAGRVPFFGMKWDELLGGKSRRKGS